MRFRIQRYKTCSCDNQLKDEDRRKEAKVTSTLRDGNALPMLRIAYVVKEILYVYDYSY